MFEVFKKIFLTIIALAFIYFFVANAKPPEKHQIPAISIANYGSHPSLNETLEGMDKSFKSNGFINKANVYFYNEDVNFDTSLIPQMIDKLKAKKPKIFIAITTPIAQAAKNAMKETPILFVNVTDPEETGLAGKDQKNIMGISDRQDMSLLLSFAQKLLPHATKVGVLYSTGEANDIAMVKLLKKAADKIGMQVIDVPLEHSRDALSRVRTLKGKVDFIYTGPSGVVQTSLPAIAVSADELNIPIINFNKGAVLDHQVLASFGVSYQKIGAKVGPIVAEFMKGTMTVEDVGIIHPGPEEHESYISKRKASQLSVTIPQNIQTLHIIE